MTTAVKNQKPLGGKAYGSIPHLPGSRMGPADHHCHEGQARIATVKTRDKHDVVIVQEKLDGSNVAVAKIPPRFPGEGPSIVALTRAGYEACTSPYEMHHKFADWVYKPDNAERFHALLDVGERICGEWLLQAHGTRYDLPHEPFVAFDLMAGKKRLNFDAFVKRVGALFTVPHTLHVGGALPLGEAMGLLGEFGHHGALEAVEGVMYRVEREGVVDYLVKYVKADKVDGKYLPEKFGDVPVWNTYRGQLQ